MTSNKINRGYGVFLIPGFALFLLVIGLPFLISLYISFTKWSGVGRPVFIGAANYIKAATDSVFWASFRNNLLMIFAVTVIPTAIGLLLSVFMFGYASKQFGNKTVAFFRAGYYLPQILPVAIAGIVWGWILNPTHGALNTIFRSLGLDALAMNWLGDPATALPSVMGIMVWFQIGYPLVIFLSALQRVDPQVLEAAEVDGAHWGHKFVINLYMIRPEILVVVLTSTIYALKLFSQIYVLTRGGPGTATMVPSYFAYQNFFEKTNVGYGSAIAMIMTAIIIVLEVAFITRQQKLAGEGEY
ncbi:MAG: sugar ABC transporter permease [Spirochaetales bacterium]|nr:sugar ABC transporter permease [Spirochaetales bacterium]